MSTLKHCSPLACASALAAEALAGGGVHSKKRQLELPCAAHASAPQLSGATQLGRAVHSGRGELAPQRVQRGLARVCVAFRVASRPRQDDPDGLPRRPPGAPAPLHTGELDGAARVEDALARARDLEIE